MTEQYTATMADIDQQRTRLRRLLRGRDRELLNRRPPNGDWSIVENVRHLLFAEQLHLGKVVLDAVDWSAVGLIDRTAKKFAKVGTQPTQDIDEVFAAWNAIHREIRVAMKSAAGPDAEKALWRNHRHLRVHTNAVERMLRRFGS